MGKNRWTLGSRSFLGSFTRISWNTPTTAGLCIRVDRPTFRAGIRRITGWWALTRLTSTRPFRSLGRLWRCSSCTRLCSGLSGWCRPSTRSLVTWSRSKLHIARNTAGLRSGWLVRGTHRITNGPGPVSIRFAGSGTGSWGRTNENFNSTRIYRRHDPRGRWLGDSARRALHPDQGHHTILKNHHLGECTFRLWRRPKQHKWARISRGVWPVSCRQGPSTLRLAKPATPCPVFLWRVPRSAAGTSWPEARNSGTNTSALGPPTFWNTNPGARLTGPWATPNRGPIPAATPHKLKRGYRPYWGQVPSLGTRVC